MADLTETEKGALIEAAIRMLNRPDVSVQDLGPVHCRKEPEVDITIADVTEQRRRRWAVTLLVASSLLALGGGIVGIGLWAGELQTTSEHHGVEIREHREEMRRLRTDLLDVERANGERATRIETAVGRLEQRVDDAAERTKRPRSRRRR